MKKLCPLAHWEEAKDVQASAEYCQKEDTRVEGPWEFGVRPARRYVKGETKERNAALLEMGAEEAIA